MFGVHTSMSRWCIGVGQQNPLPTLQDPLSAQEVLFATNGHQQPPNIHQQPPNGHQQSPTGITNHQRPPTTTNGHQQPPTPINNNQQPSATTNNHQQPPDLWLQPCVHRCARLLSLATHGCARLKLKAARLCRLDCHFRKE